MSATANAYKNLYDKERVDKVGLRRAVMRKLITAEEYQEITGEVYNIDNQEV